MRAVLLAYFGVLDRDILTCPADTIGAITPTRTILVSRDVLALGA